MDWFPSISTTYRSIDWLVTRGGYSKTINRPEFRETSPFEEINYDNNELINGNPRLLPSLSENYDLRVEFYPDDNQNGDNFSVGIFYKELMNPIERINTSIRSSFDGNILSTNITYEYEPFRDPDTHEFTSEDPGENWRESDDNIASRYHPGRYFSLSISYSF